MEKSTKHIVDVATMEYTRDDDGVIEKEELMMASLSPINKSNETKLRKGHFISPIVKGNGFQLEKHPSYFQSPLPLTFEPRKWSLKVNFMGWREPTREWTSWVHHLKSKHQSIWEKAGIFEAILSSTCCVIKDKNLIFGLVEKWCSNTKSFVFPWGEASITLEDVVVLGGYSVLGHPVVTLLDGGREMEEIEAKLKEAKAGMYMENKGKVKEDAWIKRFMFSDSEFEHEAFLSLWLGKFVLSDSDEVIQSRLFAIAVHLAKGVCLALAPTVLASIYRDLSVLKAAILFTNEVKRNGGADGGGEIDDAIATTLWSPLCLVQLWAWERFPAFQPRPKLIKDGEPRSALWDKRSSVRVGNVRLVLDSSGESFQWRPYVTGTKTCCFKEVYKEKDEWHDIESNEDILSFALCTRVSELVGLDCVEQYLPHRVAMQFGMDQDIPCSIPPSNENPEIVWCCIYRRPFVSTKIYVPSRDYEPGITLQYLEWWQSVFGLQDVINNMSNWVVQRERAPRKRINKLPLGLTKECEGIKMDTPPGFHCKYNEVNVEQDEEDINQTINEILGAFVKDQHLYNNKKVENKETVGKEESLVRPAENVEHVRDATILLHLTDRTPTSNTNDIVYAPLGFHSKNNTAGMKNHDKHMKPIFNEMLGACGKDQHIGKNGNKETLEEMDKTVQPTNSDKYVQDATMLRPTDGIPICDAADSDAADVKLTSDEILGVCDKDLNVAKIGTAGEMDSVVQPTENAEDDYVHVANEELTNGIPYYNAASNNENTGAETNSRTAEIPELLELESKIAWLDRIVAEMKVRFGRRA